MDAAQARRERADTYAELRPRPDLRLVPPEPEAAPARRTVIVTGRPDPEPVRQRRRSAASTRLSARPDRVALWAFLMGLFLVLMSVATAHA
jgi:hypothetical protein